MPIIVVPDPRPPAPPAPAGPARRQVTPPGRYRALWYPPDGSAPLDLHPLDPDTCWWSLKANAGLGAPPVDLITRDDPGGGVIVDGVRVAEKRVLWPLRVRGRTHIEFVRAWRHIVHVITQTSELGPGRLRIIRPDGTAREIHAYYAGGLEGEPGDGAWLEETTTVTLLCPDAWWRDPSAQVVTLAEESQPDYLDPYPSIASGRALSTVEITNPGERAAWPQWRIRGPLESLTAANLTRGGETFALTGLDLDVGDVVTLTSRPLRVRGPGGDNWLPKLGLLSGGGKPWRLDPGTTTQVSILAVGAQPDTTPGADDGTRIWLSWHVDYRTS